MVSNPRRFIFDDALLDEVRRDVANIILHMDTFSTSWFDIKHIQIPEPTVEVNSIALTLFDNEWTYLVKYTITMPLPKSEMRKNVNFISSQRHPALDRKMEEYLDKIMQSVEREEKLMELGI